MTAAELHFHLLPGIDDGPEDLGESIDLARAAVADGTDTVVATPHVRFDIGTTDTLEILHRACELRARLAAFSLPLDVRCGGELGHDVIASLSQAELERLAQGPSGARWLLVETPFEGVGPDFHAATAELRERHFGVLMAHPERSADSSLDGSSGLRRELDAGSLAQVNAQSLTGDHGRHVRAAAWTLIRDGLVAAVSSDAHGPIRPPCLTAARHALVEGGVTERTADLLVRVGPGRLLEDGIRPRAALAA